MTYKENDLAASEICHEIRRILDIGADGVVDNMTFRVKRMTTREGVFYRSRVEAQIKKTVLIDSDLVKE